MKLKWKRGSPEKSGFYLAWNSWEDDFPTILHCSIGVKGRTPEWWTHHVHRAVVEETFCVIFQKMIDDFFEDFKASATKTELNAINKIIRMFDSFANNKYEEGAYQISVQIDELVNSNNVCVYDVGRPDYWSEIPNLSQWPNVDELDDAREGNPNALEVEIEDVKASVINAIAQNVEYALNQQMSRFVSPWEDDTPPWRK